MNAVVIVAATAYAQAPTGIREFLDLFFKPRRMCGKDCYIGVMSISGGDHQSQHGWAPGHNLDLERFQEGLRANESVHDWLSKREGKGVWTIYDVGYNHGPRQV